ncbi:MAG: hypothetical protein WCP31_03305 [Chloroflexales bacterium]
MPRDDQGRYRSTRLPLLRGKNIQVPSRLNQTDQSEAWQRRVHSVARV